jgi:hypothetical protein
MFRTVMKAVTALRDCAVSCLRLCRSWAVKCNVVHYSWGALMINQYHGQESQLGGLTVLSYFGEQSGFRVDACELMFRG